MFLCYDDFSSYLDLWLLFKILPLASQAMNDSTPPHFHQTEEGLQVPHSISMGVLIDHSYLLSLLLRRDISASHVISSGNLLRLALLPPAIKAIAPKEKSSTTTSYGLNASPPKFMGYQCVRSSSDD